MRTKPGGYWLSLAFRCYCGLILLVCGTFSCFLGPVFGQTPPIAPPPDPKAPSALDFKEAFAKEVAEAKKGGAEKLFGPQWEMTAQKTALAAQKSTNPMEYRTLWNQARSQIWFPDPKWPAHLGRVLGDPRLRVTDSPTALAVDGSGKRLAAGLKDGTVLVWEMPSAKPLLRLAGLTNEVQALAFHPSGSRLSGGGKDDLILTWDLEEGKVVDRQAGHAEPINSIAYSPDGTQFAAAGADRKIRIHSPLTRTGPKELSGPALTVHQVAYSPDGKRVAAASADCKAWVFEVATGKTVLEQSLFTGGNAYGICFVAEGKQLAVAGANPNQLKLVDAQSGAEVKNLEPFPKAVQILQQTPGGKLILAGSQDGTLRLIDPQTGQTLRTQQYGDPYRAVALGPDATWLVIAGTDMALRTRELEHQSTGQKADAMVGEIWSVAFAQEGNRVLVGGAKNGPTLFNTNGLAQPLPLAKDMGPVSVVANAPDNRAMAVGGVDRKIRLFLPEQPIPQILEGHEGTLTALAFGPGGKILASASTDRTIKIWDVPTGKVVHSLEQAVGMPLALAIIGSGSLLAIGGGDGVIRLFDFSFKNPPRLLGGHQGAVTGLAFDPQGDRLASCGNDQRAILWNLTTSAMGQPSSSQVSLSGTKGALSAIAFAPSGQMIAVGGADRIIRIWDTPRDGMTAGKLERLSFRGHTDWVTTLAFHPTANLLLSGSVDGQLRTWDLLYRQDGPAQAGHSREIRALGYDASGKWLASAGSDGDLIVWPVGKSGESNKDLASPIRLLGLTEPINALTWLGTESTVAAVAQNHTLNIVEVPSGKVIRTINDGKSPVEIPILGYSPLGKTLMAWIPPAGMEKTPIDPTKRIEMMQLQDPALGTVKSLTLAPDGGVMAAGADDGTVRFWQTQTGKRIPEMDLRPQTEAVADLALSRGNTILATSDKAGRVTLWNTAERKKLYTIPSPGQDLAALALKNDGTKVLVASADNRLALFDVVSGKEIRSWDLRQSLGSDKPRIRAMAFSPNQPVVAIGLADGLVWELELP